MVERGRMGDVELSNPIAGEAKQREADDHEEEEEEEEEHIPDDGLFFPTSRDECIDLLKYLAGKQENRRQPPPGPIDSSESPFEKPFARPLPPFRFWIDFVAVCLMGGFLGLFGVGYVRVITEVPKAWYSADGNDNFPEDESTLSWAAGRVWWIGVGAACGIITGFFKALTDMDEFPGLIKEIRSGHVEPWMSMRVTGLAIIAQMGGA